MESVRAIKESKQVVKLSGGGGVTTIPHDYPHNKRCFVGEFEIQGIDKGKISKIYPGGDPDLQGKLHDQEETHIYTSADCPSTDVVIRTIYCEYNEGVWKNVMTKEIKVQQPPKAQEPDDVSKPPTLARSQATIQEVEDETKE